MSDLAKIIQEAVESTPYWVKDDPSTHQDPYENAAEALEKAGFGDVKKAYRDGWNNATAYYNVWEDE